MKSPKRQVKRWRPHKKVPKHSDKELSDILNKINRWAEQAYGIEPKGAIYRISSRPLAAKARVIRAMKNV